MAAEPQLVAAGSPPKGFVIFFLVLFLALGSTAFAQDAVSDQARLHLAQSAFDAGHWEEAARLAQGPADQSPEFDLLAGLALARLEKWDEAKLAFNVGARKAPGDSRFVVELAGIAYKQKDFRSAKNHLQCSVKSEPAGFLFGAEFLATIYFLEGNLEAALKYWNPEDKPRLRNVAFKPSLKLKESLRDRAVAFNAPQVLTADALLATQARLDNLGIFSNQRVELSAADSGNYDATLHLAERNGWGDSKAEGIVSLLSGLPYATIYPQFYNLGRDAVNLTSLARWDSEKRRFSLAVFNAALRQSQPALAFLCGRPKRKLEFDTDFSWSSHARDRPEHAPRSSRSGSALHREWPLELERRRGGCPSEFSKSQRPFFACGTPVLHGRYLHCSVAGRPTNSLALAGAPFHGRFIGRSKGRPGICGRSWAVRHGARSALRALVSARKRRRL